MRNTTSSLFISFFYPVIFVSILWIVWLFQVVERVDLQWYGLYPRTIHGLAGIALAPVLHADFDHLFANTIPLLVLGPIIMYFYRSISLQIFFWVYLMTGIWVWVAGRPAYHIGASGIIYGFTSFLFFSGIFRKDRRLLALSLFVTFLYGSTVWGILPLHRGISWESHLLGALAGIITAYNFRREGPEPKVYDFGPEDEPDDPDEDLPATGSEDDSQLPGIHYTYVPREEEPPSDRRNGG